MRIDSNSFIKCIIENAIKDLTENTRNRFVFNLQ